MFRSTYESAVDAKGRISVPAPFRLVLGKKSHVYLYPAVDGALCLEGCGEELMTSYEQMVIRMSPNDPVRAAFVHSVFSKSVDRKLDETGRITLPATMLENVGITDQIIFVGAYDRFHIWNPENYAAYDARMSAQVSTGQDKLDAPFQAALAAGGIAGLITGSGKDS